MIYKGDELLFNLVYHKKGEGWIPVAGFHVLPSGAVVLTSMPELKGKNVGTDKAKLIQLGAALTQLACAADINDDTVVSNKVTSEETVSNILASIKA